MDDLKIEKIIESLYVEVADNISDEVCLTCPIVRSIRDLKDAIKDKNHEKLIHELGLSFQGTEFPCMSQKR